MVASISKSKGRKGSGRGFAAIPRDVIYSKDFSKLRGNAIRLLVLLAAQFKGHNNGDLTASFNCLQELGFSSKGTLSSATDELLKANFLVRTRDGFFSNPGSQCALYALTWLPVNECPGKQLTVSSTKTPPRKFSLEINKKPSPKFGHDSVQESGRARARGSDGKFISVQK